MLVSWRALITAACFSVSLPAAALSQEQRSRVLLADSVKTAEAGDAVSFLFTIESPSGAGGTASVELPGGWRTLTGEGPLPVGSRRIAYLVAAAIPSGAAAGRYPVSLVIQTGGEFLKSTAWAIVPARTSISLSSIGAPGIVVAGSTIDGAFLLTNRGNAAATVRVRLRAPALSRRDSVFVELAPGASREIPVVWETDSRSRALIQSVTYASAEVIGHTKATASSSFRVTVAPEEAYAAAPVHSIASRMRIFGASSERGGTGAEISGSGLLRDGSGARISYVARHMQGPQSIFGDRTEYRVAVSSPHFSAVAGHHAYRLTRLSESGRFAAGALAEARSNGWTVGGFFNRDNSRPDKPEQRALFLNRDFGNGNLLSVNFLDKKETQGGTMLAARATISTLPFGTVEAEAGHAINSTQAEAWAVSAHGRFERFNYTVARQKSDNAYPGSTRGSESSNASFEARPRKGVRLRGTFNDNRIDRVAHGPMTGESHHWGYLGGMTLLDRVAVEYRRNGRNDGSFRLNPEREEQLVAARVNGRVSGASLVASAAFGTGSGGVGPKRRFERYFASATIRKSRNLSMSVNAEALRGGTLFLPQQKSELKGGLSASYTSGSSRFSVSGYASHRRLPETARDATLEASWERSLPSGHSFALRARINHNPGFESADASIVRAEYTLPFGMPAGASRTRARVSGRVTDASTGTAVAGAMIQLGKQVAITDGKGRFAFPVDSEGPVDLAFVGSATTAGTIPLRRLPVTITPRMGHTSIYDIALTRAGRIDGKIRRFVNEPGYRPGVTPRVEEDPLGLPRARVELSNGSEILYSMTNGSGEFAFTELRPGEWTLRIAARDIPEYFQAQDDSVVINVRAGERATAEMRVLQRKRKITIVEIR